MLDENGCISVHATAPITEPVIAAGDAELKELSVLALGDLIAGAAVAGGAAVARGGAVVTDTGTNTVSSTT